MMKKLTSLALALSTVFFLSSCGEDSKTTAKTADSTVPSAPAYANVTPASYLPFKEANVELAKNQKINVNLGSFPDTIDPGLFSDATSYAVAKGLLDTLFRQGPKGDYIPVTAKSYEVSEDGLTWTIKLREDANWSDGKPVTAQDFVYAWQRLIDPKTGSQYADYLGKNAFVVNADDIVLGKKDPSELGVRAVDDKTLELKLTQPVPWLVQVISYGALAPVRKDVVEKYGAAWTRPENFVGNGPYKLASYVVNDEIVIVKDHRYWDASNIAIEEVRFVFIKDNNTAYYKYVAGELLFTAVPPQLKKTILEKHPNEVRESPTPKSSYFAFNHRLEKFQDARVRRAIALLIDNRFIIKNIYANGEPTSVFVPTYVQDGQLARQADYWDKSMEERRKEAIDLLTQAGYSKEKPFNLEFKYSQSQTVTKVFVALQGMLDKETGGIIKVTGSSSEWKTFLGEVKNGNFEVSLSGWGADYDQVSTFYNILLCGNTNNYSHWCNKEYDTLVKTANATASAEERARLYAQANLVLQREMGIVPFNWPKIYALVNPYLGGYNLTNDERYYRDFYIVCSTYCTSKK